MRAAARLQTKSLVFQSKAVIIALPPLARSTAIVDSLSLLLQARYLGRLVSGLWSHP